jgi:hypothetical protein
MNPPTPALNPASSSLLWLRSFCVLILTLALFTACQTHKTDWSARIGNYTFDDAVTEMGPPDKTATLSDGTQVCEWLTYRGSDGGTVIAPSFYGTYVSTTSGSPDAFIRLTFDPEKKLTAAKRIYK